MSAPLRAVAALAIVAVQGAYVYRLAGQHGGYRMVDVSQRVTVALMKGGVPRTTAVQMLQANARNLERAWRFLPNDPAVAIVAGSQYLLLGDYPRAASWYRRADAIEPRPETAIQLARALTMQGQRAAAVESYARAVRFSRLFSSNVPLEMRADVETAARR